MKLTIVNAFLALLSHMLSSMNPYDPSSLNDTSRKLVAWLIEQQQDCGEGKCLPSLMFTYSSTLFQCTANNLQQDR